VSSRAEELREHRERLLTRIAAERTHLSSEYSRLAGGAGRADGWLTLARRLTPVAAVGAIAIGLVLGPGRIVRLLQAATVPVLLLRQVLGRSEASGDTLKSAFRILGWRRRTHDEP
jgi:hypothetical protein